MIIQLNNFYGVPHSGLSAHVRYLALVGELRQRAENMARLLHVDMKIVEGWAEQRHKDQPVDSSAEVWEWVIVELLSGRKG